MPDQPAASPIAVVGFSGVFPGASDPERFWRAVVEKKEGICEVPRDRWVLSPKRVHAKGVRADRVLSTRAGLVHRIDLDPDSCRLPGDLVRRLDPVYHLALCSAKRAWSSVVTDTVDLRHAGVILAAIALPTEAASKLAWTLLGGHLKQTLFQESSAAGPDFDAAMAARVTGLPAAVVARELGFGGVSYTLDAACASSLYAVKLACDELRAGRADAMLAGGVSRPDGLYTQIGFSQLRALSPTGRCAAFDASADGLVVGEGCGILVLKRLEDALAQQDRIWGVIRGVGLSNDMRGNLLAPDPEGQLRAMRAAYAQAGWRPEDVDLIECHGAGTPVGDRTELESLNRLWSGTDAKAGTCPIGSVKTVTGHLLVAAGAAGLIKTLLAMDQKTLPPSLHFTAAPENSPLARGPFRVQTAAARWPERDEDTPRRAAVSAFGFGGINAHLLIEEWRGEPAPAPPRSSGTSDAPSGTRRPPDPLPPVAIVGMAAAFGDAADIGRFADAALSGGVWKRPRPAHRWKGAEAALPGAVSAAMNCGAFMDELLVGIGEFKIPPSEIPDILPQHLLMLRVAGRALADAGLHPGTERPRSGAVVGLDFDCEATNFHLRWRLQAERAQWESRLGLLSDDPAHRRWFSSLQDACSPPLTANRTLGALAGLIGSRIAREFAFGGPSFTVSDGPAAGLRALEIGARALAKGELELVLVGAVDFAGDLRASWIAAGQEPAALTGDGAAAVALKRLDRATADGDRIYAVLRGTGTSGGSGFFTTAADSQAWHTSLSLALGQAAAGKADIGLLEVVGPPPAEREGLPAPSRIEDLLGTPGAATGMAALVRAALCLHRRRLPAASLSKQRPWPTRTSGTLRRACVAVSTVDGNCVHAILEEPPAAASKTVPAAAHRQKSAGRAIAVAVGGRPVIVGPPPNRKASPASSPRAQSQDTQVHDLSGEDRVPAQDSAPRTGRPQSEAAPGIANPASGFPPPDLGTILRRTTDAATRAHERFLSFSQSLNRAYTEAIDLQTRLIEAGGNAEPLPAVPAAGPPPAYDRGLCMEFAVGSAATVLGPAFAELDTYRVRVRLPDEPLMLVDRILSVEGEKGSLSSGRVVTEHDVPADAWYLDGGKAPVCISVEAGQADLFLCSYLGIDLKVRGERAYRLLDATVSFHRGLPEPGDTIRYDIEIEKFVRQGDTWLFFFHFVGTIENRRLITMTDGCAGFFTPEEVENSGGILLTEEERRPKRSELSVSVPAPIPMARESYDDQALSALRKGDARGGFGGAFPPATIPEPLRLPGGRMHLIDRIVELDPQGGRYGLGSIRAEADIDPEAWFLTCHFIDDRVMPGTLMYECCAHTLRVFLQRMGWFTDSGSVVYEPKPGVRSILKCRGPVTPRTRKVLYEVHIRQLGFDPAPFAVADAHMFADGRRIVMFRDMSMQVTGLTRTDIDRFWRSARTEPAAGSEDGGKGASPPAALPSSAPAPVFTREQILAFAGGKPSKAFGPRFAPFDEGRFIARLPAPPYSFIDRIVGIDAPANVMAPGGWVEAEFDVKPDDWYFAANRAPSMPYAVLQETALQVCGFTAAYVGSSLTTDKALRFRNLGGEAVQHRDVAPRAQVLRTRCRLIRVNTAADMIIQDFEMSVSDETGSPVYDGSTHFGFFTETALAQQVGIRDAADDWGHPDRAGSDPAESVVLEAAAPHFPGDPERTPASGLALPANALLMIDRAEWLPDGGPQGLGIARGEKRVDPNDWFFAAHFFQDPVCPGSLGLESLLQLLKFAALRRFGTLAPAFRFSPMLGETHRWTYRGQILPTNRRVTVEAVLTRVEDEPVPAILADGLLRVDGLPIYRMENFGIRLTALEPHRHHAA